MPGPFATATELAERVGHPAPPDDLARWQAALLAASSAIRRFTGQTLSQVTGDQITVQPMYSPTSGQLFPLPRAYGEIIFLPERPVTAITALTVNAVAFTAYAFTSAGLVYRTDGLAWTAAATITYSHGYAETSDEFEAIKTVCLNIVQRALFGPQSEVFGPEQVEARGWPADIHLAEQDKMDLQTLETVRIG